MTKNGLDQYADICTDAIKKSGAKVTKRIEKILIEVLTLYMIIPRKINFTQMERYGTHDEQTYRNNFCYIRSKIVNWLKLNVAKVMMKEIGMDYSMASFKSLMFNTYLTKRIFKTSGYRPNRTLINKIFKDLFCLQRKAA